MRDNHKGMPEIIDACEKDGIYFGIIKIEIEGIYKKFQFGVSYKGYLALKRILQLRPFDKLPGLKHKYFFAQAYYKITDMSDCGVYIRVEQDKNGKQMDVRVPKDLLANLIWFSELKSFDEAAHLPEVS
jgi:hypothetical protein